MKTLTLLVLLIAAPVSATPITVEDLPAPIYTNRSDAIYQHGPDQPFDVWFWAEQPCRYGAFFSETLFRSSSALGTGSPGPFGTKRTVSRRSSP